MRSIFSSKLTLSLRQGCSLRARQYSTINPPSTVRAPRIQRRWLLLGGGLLTCSVLYSGSTIYMDSINENDDKKPKIDDFRVKTMANGENMAPWKIRRINSAQLASNNPIEDFLSFRGLEYTPTLTLVAITLLDGHNGPQTAQFLSELLPQTVGDSIGDRFERQVVSDNMFHLVSGRNYSGIGESPSGTLTVSHGEPVLSPGVMDDAIKEAFVRLDDYIVHDSARRVLGLSKDAYEALQCGDSTDASPSEDNPLSNKLSRTDATKLLEYAHSGSCAIMALYDPTQQVLKIAQTGDSRAVLGRRVSDPSQGQDSDQQNPKDSTPCKAIWETHVLSADHNANNPSEAARLTALHPDEPELLKNGRTLGWGPSRAFGDASMKWPIPVQQRMKEEFMGGSPREVCKTPPYFTAEPEVTTFHVQKGDFMVIATDGLWDCLTSEEVVGLTGWWVDEQNKRVLRGMQPKVSELGVGVNKGAVRKRRSFFRSLGNGADATPPIALEPKELPVKFGEDYKDKTPMYPYWRAKKQFINVDKENVGKHLIRNALGGADEDLRGALLAMKPPRSRRFRWILLGGGLLAGSALHFGSTIYLDGAGEDTRKRQNRVPPCFEDFLVNTTEYSSSRSNKDITLDTLKIRRIHCASHNSNDPIEDAIHIGEIEFSPTLRYASFGVYDGHIGGETANYLSQNLPTAVAGSLADHLQRQLINENPGAPLHPPSPQVRAPGVAPDPSLSPEAIDEAIKEAFVRVDDHLVHEAAQVVLGLSDEAYAALQRGETMDASRSTVNNVRRKLTRVEAIKALQFAHSGACALMAFYDPTTRLLRIAQTGDCRAILGRRINNTTRSGEPVDNTKPKDIWETHVLSAEQGLQNPSEVARVTALHPNEPDLLKNGRYLGWAITRAFGDASMKWPISVQKRLKDEFMGNTPRAICKTPPYFTAEPEVTTFQVQKGDFMVLATDGLWDCLTNEEVVGLIGLWVESQNQKAMNSGVNTITFAPKELPVHFGEDYKDETTMYASCWQAEKRFINVDGSNVGKHLIRNALGGADEDLRGALLAMQPPRSRDFRDDISIVVVFFD